MSAIGYVQLGFSLDRARQVVARGKGVNFGKIKEVNLKPTVMHIVLILSK